MEKFVQVLGVSWQVVLVMGALVVLVLAPYAFFKSLAHKEGILAGFKKPLGVLFRKLP